MDTLLVELGDGAEVALDDLQPYVKLPAPPKPTVRRQRREEPVVPGVSLETAELAGCNCRACAWVETTRVEVRMSPDRFSNVTGVRSWRGMALFDHIPAALRDSGMRLYAGPVAIDGQTHMVEAEVMVHSMRTVAAERSYVVVEFTGAGNLRLSA